ncbi:DUF2853 family protein [Robiginitalea marina]|jgi:hypothetical protein|uniref:DUF2853 family protein n=1 Tax=Robiginitalea marina TaxID=2954105 RepID=A0ABT1AUG4_9FLAO|nr:DUF2853 family protein [Robiginitalea marina]MCO5723678.1 DUF2853 family protein [Robiginitalea marina]
MSKSKEELLENYAEHIREKFKETPDMEFLDLVTVGLGPAIYNRDSSLVSGTDESELETVRKNFLVKKLGLPDGPHLMHAIKEVMREYGASERNKYRAVVYYILARRFKKENVYR